MLFCYKKNRFLSEKTYNPVPQRPAGDDVDLLCKNEYFGLQKFAPNAQIFEPNAQASAGGNC